MIVEKDEYLAIKKAINYFADILKNETPSNTISHTSFSRIMLTFYDIELEPKKINFTQNPHAQHIHIFNRDNNGMIRIMLHVKNKSRLQWVDILHLEIFYKMKKQYQKEYYINKKELRKCKINNGTKHGINYLNFTLNTLK